MKEILCKSCKHRIKYKVKYNEEYRKFWSDCREMITIEEEYQEYCLLTKIHINNIELIKCNQYVSVYKDPMIDV